MYLLNIKNVTDKKILSNIYNNINQFGLGDKFFIVYEPDFSQSVKIDKNILAHVILINPSQLKAYSEEVIEDLILDLIEMGGFVLFRCSDCEDTDLVASICNSFKLNHLFVRDSHYENNIDLVNSSINDVKIIDEIINSHVDENRYSTKDFIFRYTVEPSGNIIDGYSGETIMNLDDSDFIDILFHKPEGFDELKKDAFREYDAQTGLSCYFYEPWIFLMYKNDLHSKIIDYKMKVFDAIKNIDPEDYPLLRPEIAEIFNNAGYIKLNDIKKIINDNEV